MYYAQITNGVVTAVTETAAPIDAANMISIDSLDVSLLGQSYAAGVFTPPPPVSLIPSVLTMRQARLALFTAGLINSVQAAINALPSPDKEKAQIEWDYSNEVQRHNGFVSQLAPALGLTSEQVDALFVTGAAL